MEIKKIFVLFLIASLIIIPTPVVTTAGTTYTVYLPLVFHSYPPDPRFGVAEYGAADMAVLGFPEDGRYHAQQWSAQEEANSVIFLRPAHRSASTSRWCTGAYKFAGHTDYCADPAGTVKAVSTGWVNESGLCQWVREHPRRAYIIGNELLCPEPCGDGVTAAEYAQWYADAWTLIKSCGPTARVGPFGPVGEGSKAILADVWLEYHALTGEPLPVDFFPIHHYAQPGFRLTGEIA